MDVELAQADDAPEIRALFRASLMLGRPLPFADDAPALVAAYERFCLDWYLDPANPAVAGVLRDRPGDRTRGYALVCLGDAVYTRSRRRAAARFALAAGPALLRGRATPDAARFLRYRLADGWALRHPHPSVRGLPHAHLNADLSRGRGLPGRALTTFIDQECARAGHRHWYGEINARAGRRAAAITRWWGAQVVHRAPNRTLSWLLGEPVERLTVRRVVPPDCRALVVASVHRDLANDAPVDPVEDLVEVGAGDGEPVVALTDHGA